MSSVEIIWCKCTCCEGKWVLYSIRETNIVSSNFHVETPRKNVIKYQAFAGRPGRSEVTMSPSSDTLGSESDPGKRDLSH